MMRFLLFTLVGVAMIAPIPSEARPISYPGGWSVMTMNNGDSNGFNAQYSPSSTYSLGYTFEHWREANFNLHALQVNNLLKRWNHPDSQANLYVESGVGLTGVGDGAHPVAYTGLKTDWEDRRFLVSYENRYIAGEDIDDFYMESARIGIAPYIGEFGDLHTWLMVQVDHSPEREDPLTFTPMVRMFKGYHLVEGGVSNQGKVMFNWMIQF